MPADAGGPTTHGVRLDLAGPLATVTLARPEQRNAQTPQMWRELAAVGRRVLDSGARVVVLRGTGPSFSAGLDRAMFTPGGIPGEPTLADLGAMDDAALDATIAGFQEAFTWWRDDRVVSIAAVAGHAVGAGFQLALACDLRLLADDAALAMREPSLGLVPDLAGTKPLVDLIGFPRALEICATGRWVDAPEALRLGLAELVVARDELEGATADLVAALLDAPAEAVRATAGLLRAAASRSYDEQRAAERAAQRERLRALARAMGG